MQDPNQLLDELHWLQEVETRLLALEDEAAGLRELLFERRVQLTDGHGQPPKAAFIVSLEPPPLPPPRGGKLPS